MRLQHLPAALLMFALPAAVFAQTGSGELKRTADEGPCRVVFVEEAGGWKIDEIRISGE